MSSKIARVRGCTVLLWVALNKINREAARKGDMSPAAFSILKLLYASNSGKVRMQDLAKLNDVSKSTATDYIDNLEKKGYVARAADDEDRRGLYVRLTKKGEDVARENEEKILRYLEKCASSLTGEEMSTFSGLFSRFMGGVGTVPFPELFDSAMKIKFE